MIKLLSNVHAAMLITFWNYVKPICDKFNLNVYDVARILLMIDERVSKYGTIAGSAYGGTCLPKDMRQLVELCKSNGLSHSFLDEIEKINSWYDELGISRGGL
jgi:UDPglucose 6-dehydrogenase